MQCSSLECFSEAVARSKNSNRVYCISCAIKIAGNFGAGLLETLPGAKFPWDCPIEGKCPTCGVEYNGMIIGVTGGCPSCKNSLGGTKYDKM